MAAIRAAGCANLRNANLRNADEHLQNRAIGGPEGIRTPDLLNAIQARSQLRHGPTTGRRR
jgi:hypothetical protein